MLNVIAGKLGSDVEVKTIDTKNGARAMANNTVYVWTGENNQKNIPVQITAWGDQATELAKYAKGDGVMFVGQAKDVSYTPKGTDTEITTMGYDVLKIDHDKQILKESDSLLRAYIKDGKEKGTEKTEKDNSKKDKNVAKELSNKSKAPKQPELKAPEM